MGLARGEKQIPQITEDTEKPEECMESLDSVGSRPGQARYEAALRPDSSEFLFYWILQLLPWGSGRIALPEVCQNALNLTLVASHSKKSGP
jgi:hypothetical protein